MPYKDIHDPRRRGNVHRTCELCGSTFRARRYKVAAGMGRLCSPECRQLADREPAAHRLAARTDTTSGLFSCWLWMGPCDKDGYGELSARAELGEKHAHRVAYTLAYGLIPKGMCVCHTCDNPRCVNPLHLFLGDNRTNIADRHMKGRDARGERNGSAKLTREQVRIIRAQYAAGGWSYDKLAARFNVSDFAIAQIVLGRTWQKLD